MNLKKLMLLSSLFIIVFSMVYINSSITNNTHKTRGKNSVEVLMTNSNGKNISEKQAIKNVKEHLHKTGAYVPPRIDIDSVDGNYYLVHAYEIINNEDESHTATAGWFYVNVNTGEVVDIIN
ncbi:MAG: hypothetical protein ACRC3Y_00580 [Romboutsia sp.]|uniref:hypothetical protein n=1 Tax=Romboutsia sp. TaxID=1965302 RepID=UPI003F3AD460